MILDLEDLSDSQKLINISLQQLKEIGQAQSKVLAAYIVLYRSLGMFKTIAVVCMEELARRRILGEEFDYENYIEAELNKLPKTKPLDFNLLQGLLNTQILSNLVKSKL